MMTETNPTTTAGMIQPGFRIGRYTLRDGYSGADKVWIGSPGGEGGDFSAEALEALIAKHYADNF